MTRMRPLRLLFDSNVFFACVDISKDRRHKDAEEATRLVELANKLGCEVVLSPATKSDIDHARSKKLREASTLLMRQWPTLKPVPVPTSLRSRAGYGAPLVANDDIDLQMLAALDMNAVDFLVTQDKALRLHAAQAGFINQVASIRGAIEHLEQLLGESAWFPTIAEKKGYQVDLADPIFESLRADYAGFDDWFRNKVQRQDRDCLVIEGPDGLLEALVVLKDASGEDDYDMSGAVLKLCTVKVAEHAQGLKRGELLLKAVFDYAHRHGFDLIYVEVKPKHPAVIFMLNQFGFVDTRHRKSKDRDGDLVIAKQLRATPADYTLAPLEFHRRFGPPAVLVCDVFAVPIQPRWHDILFPEATNQLQITRPAPAGNAILKAYLCRASTRQLQEGSLLLFYRSGDVQAVTVVGVVDGLLRSDDPATIRRFVGQRTVYPDSEIERMCGEGEVLAVLFRQDRVLSEPWDRQQLIQVKVLSAPPQSIVHADKEEGLIWLRTQLDA